MLKVQKIKKKAQVLVKCKFIKKIIATKSNVGFFFFFYIRNFLMGHIRMTNMNLMSKVVLSNTIKL